MKFITQVVNPMSFYAILLNLNYLVKSTDIFFIFTTVFIPSIFYVCFNLKKFVKKDISFKIVFFSMFLPFLDFVSFFLLLNCMKQYSSFLCISFCVILFISISSADYFLDLIVVLITFICVSSLFSTVLDYELYGVDNQFEIIGRVFSSVSNDNWYAFLFCFTRIIIKRNAFKDVDCSQIDLLSVAFMALYSGLYAILTPSNLNNERFFSQSNPYFIIFNILFVLVWLLTLDKLDNVTYNVYIIMGLIILLFYFIFPLDLIFNITKIDSSLYFVYLILFSFLICHYVVLLLMKSFPVDIVKILENNNFLIQDSTANEDNTYGNNYQSFIYTP